MAAVARKRRDIIRASLMKFENRIIKFERKSVEVGDCPLMQCLIRRLEAMETEFKQHHQLVINVIEEDDDEELQKEQVILDEGKD